MCKPKCLPVGSAHKDKKCWTDAGRASDIRKKNLFVVSTCCTPDPLWTGQLVTATNILWALYWERSEDNDIPADEAADMVTVFTNCGRHCQREEVVCPGNYLAGNIENLH